jgi:peptidyl-prolyl cis-trans isomerase D
MEFLRNAAKTWVAKTLMALLVLSFGIWGIRDVSSSFLADILSFTGWGPKDLVHVGGKTIVATEYTQALNRQMRNIQQQSGQKFTVDDAHRMGLDKQVLDSLISGASVDAQRDKLQLALSDNEIRQSIFSNRAFFDDTGKFDKTIFHRVLDQNQLSEESFVAGERQNKLRATLTGLADAPIKLPIVLGTALAQYKGETRDAKYFSFVAKESDVAAPTDVDLKKQYELTPAAYTAPEYRSVAIMKVEPSDIADKLSISDDELKAGYEKNKGDYFTPEKRSLLQLSFPSLDEAKKAKARIAAGEDIIKIAGERGAKESDITLKDKQSGDFLDAKIADSAFGLAKDAVSDPIEGSLTIALLKVTSITPEKQSTLDEVKPQLIKRLQLDKAKDEIQAIYDAVETGRGEQTKFEDIAKKVGIPFVLVPAVSAVGSDKAGKDAVMPSKAEVLKAAFASDVGQIDDALSINDSYFWYEVREVIPSALKPLDTIKEDVKKDYVAAKLRDAAAEKAKKFVERAKAGATLDALATESGGTVKAAAGLKRNETSDTFDNAAVSAFFAAPDKGFAWSLEGDGRTARVMQVEKISVPAVMAVSPETKKMQDDAAAGLSSDVVDSFVKAMRENANVTINDALWKQNTGAAFAADQAN